MVRPAVTVVVPTFDRAAYLLQALESAFAQTREDFVLLVSDNASTDGTADVVASFDDPRLVYVRQATNLGMCGNINAAFAQVTTPYVALLLDDDLWEPTFLERTLALLDAEPRVGLVHTAFRVVDGDGRCLVERMDWHEGGGRTGVRPGRDLVADLLVRDDPVMVSSTVLRTEALPLGGWDARDVQAEDVGVFLRLALDWDVAFIAEPLAAFRMHQGSVSVAAGEVLGVGTFPGFRQVAQRQQAKDRFLDEEGGRLDDVEHWRSASAAKARTDALGTVWARTHQDRRVGATLRLLKEADTEVPGVLRDRRAWRLLALAMATAPRRALSPSRPSRAPRQSPTAR